MKKKTSQKKFSRIFILGSIAAAIVLPASVYASFIPDSNEEALNLTVEDIPTIFSTSEEIFSRIVAGDYEGAINGILGGLGELGLVNPADESARIGAGTNPDYPYANPQSPEEVYNLQRHVGTARSEIVQRLSQIVFSPQGQESLAQQSQAIESAQQVSLDAQQGSSDSSNESIAQAEQNADYAGNVGDLNNKAQSAGSSQEILRALAAQNQELANGNAGNSVQLAQLSVANSALSAQMSTLNTQLSGLNEKQEMGLVLDAAQNDQIAQMNARIDHQNQYEQDKDFSKQVVASQSISFIYIPGLVGD